MVNSVRRADDIPDRLFFPPKDNFSLFFVRSSPFLIEAQRFILLPVAPITSVRTRFLGGWSGSSFFPNSPFVHFLLE